MDCKKWCLVLASVFLLAALEQAESYTSTVQYPKADSKNSLRTLQGKVWLKTSRTFGGLRHKQTKNHREKQVKRTEIIVSERAPISSTQSPTRRPFVFQKESCS